MNNITVIDLLCLMFVYLKLTGQIQWNWIWVISPLIIMPILTIVIGGLVMLWGITLKWFKSKEDININ